MAPSLLAWLRDADPGAVQALAAAVQPLPLPPPQDGAGVGLPLAAVAGLVQGVPAALWPPALARAVPARRVAFAAGRLAAELALARAGADGAPGVGMGERRQPLWPEGWRGAITHHARWAGALVAPASQWDGVGLDVEALVDAPGLDAIVSTCLTPPERTRWLDGTDDRLRATVIFSAKEALFKALQPGGPAWVDFTDVAVIALTGEELHLQALPGTAVAARLPWPASARWMRLRDEIHTQVLRSRGSPPSA